MSNGKRIRFSNGRTFLVRNEEDLVWTGGQYVPKATARNQARQMLDAGVTYTVEHIVCSSLRAIDASSGGPAVSQVERWQAMWGHS